MTIDIEDIKKISLKEDELLVVKVSSEMDQVSLDNMIDMLEEFLPKNWQKKIIITTDKVEFIKINKKEID